VESKPRTSEAGEVWTVARILDWTAKYLKQNGSDTPRLDAEILLAHVRRCPRIQLYTNFDVPLTEPERAAMRDLVKRRANAEPVAYLVGKREFYGLNFEVNSQVLIPRPDTETLVLNLIELARPLPEARILDLGTGSGCIPISAAVNLPNARLMTVDISPGALEVARRNAEAHKVSDRVEFREGDLFGGVPAGEQFDFVVSNPPYIPENELDTLDRDVRCHEPRLALDGGPAGMVVVSRVITDAPQFLKPGGWLLVEIDSPQADLCRGVVAQTNSYDEVRVENDAERRPRVVMARRKT
jgi:release factor glutamine methyltransferase